MIKRRPRKPSVLPRHLNMPLSKLLTRIAWPHLRGPVPSVDKVKEAGWRMGVMYRHADYRDFIIMLARTRCPAQGAVAKTIALQIQRRQPRCQ